MSDFISRLVDRAQGHGAIVQPVVRPLFSEGPALTEPALEASAIEPASVRPFIAARPGSPAAESSRAAAIRDDVAPRSAAIEDHLAPAASNVAAATPPRAVHAAWGVPAAAFSAGAGTLTRVAIQPPSAAEPPTRDPPSPSDGAEAHPAARETAAGPPVRAGFEPARAHTARTDAAPAPADLDAFRTADLEVALPVTGPQPPPPPRMGQPRAEPVPPPTVGDSTRSLLAAALIRPDPAVRPAAARPSVPEPVPTVRVSIGRIDVRAEAPPPTPTVIAARPPSGFVSLDEYLRRGGRP